jgi:hypothetical protein
MVRPLNYKHPWWEPRTESVKIVDLDMPLDEESVPIRIYRRQRRLQLAEAITTHLVCFTVDKGIAATTVAAVANNITESR